MNSRPHNRIHPLTGRITTIRPYFFAHEEVREEHYRTLLGYYKANEDGLLSAYDRGIPIPDTSEPGVIHHARLGSMESNIFTLVGNRMKGRRACWSIRGATNLANLLCLYHTMGFEVKNMK